VQVYDKRMLATFGPFEDGLYFSPGREPGFMETPWGPLGVSICYDLFFPELMKAQALAGATLLVNISASPSSSRRFFEAVLPARAIENALPVAYTNFAGTQESLVFWGGAQVWGARGTLKGSSAYYEEARLEVVVDLEEARLARALRPTVRDTVRENVQDLMDLFQER
jgi:5-aminopentanamidase